MNSPQDTRVGNWTTEGKVKLGFALALSCLLLIGIIAFWSVTRMDESAAWVEHSDVVIGELETLLSSENDAEAAQRGFIITGDERTLEPYRSATLALQASLERLLVLAQDNAQQQQRLMALKTLVRARLDSLATISK